MIASADPAFRTPVIGPLAARASRRGRPRLWAGIYIVAGSWHFILASILCGHDLWWGSFLYPVAVFELAVAYTVLVAAQPGRVRELELSRARVAEGSTAQLRRIEQDLHDGAQAQMVAVVMKLGLAGEHLRRAVAGSAEVDLPRVLGLVDAAREGTQTAIDELRDLARGISPPVLDEGLAVALRTLTDRSGVPVDLSVDLPRRLPLAIESIAYFCAAELLANVGKHSGARRVTIEAVQRPGVVRLRVTDDGGGGAHTELGGGLAGLAERVGTLDGTLEISSPPGGPTTVAIELPSS